MCLAVLDEPLPLLLVVEVLHLHLIPTLPLCTRDYLSIAVLNDLLVLERVVLLLGHHVMRAVPLGRS